MRKGTKHIHKVQNRDIHMHSVVPPLQGVLQSGNELGLAAGVGFAKSVL